MLRLSMNSFNAIQMCATTPYRLIANANGWNIQTRLNTTSSQSHAKLNKKEKETEKSCSPLKSLRFTLPAKENVHPEK